jgi:SAM-dependent methyltransferase
VSATEQGRGSAVEACHGGPPSRPSFAQALNRRLRRWIPSTALLSRGWPFRVISWLPDLFARAVLGLLTRQPLPPLPLMVRTGVGNSILFPHYYYLTASAPIWMYFFANRYAGLDSTIVDIGSGVGKSAVGLRDGAYMGERFRGRYLGFDVDPEMVTWCRAHFPADRFSFTRVDVASTVYNPAGSASRPRLECPDGTADLVFSQSLFSHLLEEDLRHYLAESHRMLKPGGWMLMTFFCLDDLEGLGLMEGRWTFSHSVGAARVENARYPESAVSYTRSWMVDAARSAGFAEADVILPNYQSTIACRKGA